MSRPVMRFARDYVTSDEQYEAVLSRLRREAEAQDSMSFAACPKAVARLRRVAVGPDASSGEAPPGTPCAVCKEDSRSGEELLVLPCSHSFHSTCVLPWLSERSTCPLCRCALPALHTRNCPDPGPRGPELGFSLASLVGPAIKIACVAVAALLLQRGVRHVA